MVHSGAQQFVIKRNNGPVVPVSLVVQTIVRNLIPIVGVLNVGSTEQYSFSIASKLIRLLILECPFGSRIQQPTVIVTTVEVNRLSNYSTSEA